MLNIAICEDEAKMSEQMQKFLNQYAEEFQENFQISVFTNGIAFLENYTPRFDIVLMDIQMPVMNGYEAVKAIRQLPGKRGSIPVVALTANAFEEDRKKALDAGMNGHIAKPLNMERLLLTMGEILSDCIFS